MFTPQLFFFFSLFLFSIAILFIPYTVEAATLSCKKTATVDIVVAIDNTMSMVKSEGDVRRQLPMVMDDFELLLPDTRFGLVTFNDEPTACLYPPPTNYCARCDLPLTLSKEQLNEALLRYDPRFGDHVGSEDSMGALLVAALSPAIGWRPLSTKNYFRVVLVATDAGYRYPGDEPGGRICPPKMGLRDNNGDGEYDCDHENFPTTVQVRDALSEKSILPLFLTFDNWQKENPLDTYNQLLDQWGIGGTAVGQADGSRLVQVVTEMVESVVCAAIDPPPFNLEEEQHDEPITTTTTTTTTQIETTTTATISEESSSVVAIGVSAAAGGALILAGAFTAAFYFRSQSNNLESSYTPDDATIFDDYFEHPDVNCCCTGTIVKLEIDSLE